MSTESKSKIHGNRFQVESVEITDPPEGMPDGNWCRYVIGQGTSKIECIRSGSLKAVTQHAEAYARDLNDRFSKGLSPYAQHHKKTK